MKKCTQVEINQADCMKQLKHINLNIHKIYLEKTLNSHKLSILPPLEEDEEDFSDDLEPLVTNIPMKETVDFIMDQIYV